MATRQQAEQAILQLNLRHVVFEGEGGPGGGVSNGPLVVRRCGWIISTAHIHCTAIPSRGLR